MIRPAKSRNEGRVKPKKKADILPIFLRVHSERVREENIPERIRDDKPESTEKTKKKSLPPQLPEYALILDSETRTSVDQTLMFAIYRICRLVNGKYLCEREGLVYHERLSKEELNNIGTFIHNTIPECEVPGFPPRVKFDVYQSFPAFMEHIFFPALRKGWLFTFFNAAFDISRLSLEWEPTLKGGFGLILSRIFWRKTQQWIPNPYRPKIRIEAKDAKTAFISRGSTKFPEEWPNKGRILDLSNLLNALFDDFQSLKEWCKYFREKRGYAWVRQKIDHEPCGYTSLEELAYCRGDVQCTQDILNCTLLELGFYDLPAVLPDKIYSAAGLGQAHLMKMGIIPPAQKFKVPPEIKGVAMQGYSAGRAEDHIRRTKVPIVYCDFLSQYPTLNYLLNNWETLTAESVTFPECTDEIIKFLHSVEPKEWLDKCFQRETWPQLRWWAKVVPNDDLICPIRAPYDPYDPKHLNIGDNYFAKGEPVWISGPNLVASIFRTRNVPEILKAYKIVPSDKKQEGMKSITVRGIAKVDPYHQDFFKTLIECRKANSKDESLKHSLKIVANGTAYGKFIELNEEIQPRYKYLKVCFHCCKPIKDRYYRLSSGIFACEECVQDYYREQQKASPAKVQGIEEELRSHWIDGQKKKPRAKRIHEFNPSWVSVYSGDHFHSQSLYELEVGGKFYFPPLAELICAGSHLLLAMVEECVTRADGTWLACDTDSFMIVANKKGGMVPGAIPPYDLEVDRREYAPIPALSHEQVLDIVKRFRGLNPYSFGGDLLQIKDINRVPDKKGDPTKELRVVYGYGISVKRYVLLDEKGNILEAKGHGLGCWMSPAGKDEPDWIELAWKYVLTQEGILDEPEPYWIDYPAMMSIPVSSPAVVGRLKGFCKPYDFVLAPALRKDKLSPEERANKPILIARFTRHSDQWERLTFYNTRTGQECKITTDATKCRQGVILAKTYRQILNLYPNHPEYKFADFEGNPCDNDTRGILQRRHITEGPAYGLPGRNYCGKEQKRRLEQGVCPDPVDVTIDNRVKVYKNERDLNLISADPETLEKMNPFSDRILSKASKLQPHTIAAIRRGDPVKKTTLQIVVNFLKGSSRPSPSPPVTVIGDSLAGLPSHKQHKRRKLTLAAVRKRPPDRGYSYD